MAKLMLENGVIVTPDRILNDCVVMVDGKIDYIGPAPQNTQDYQRIDCQGNYIAPGFIDMHLHGGGGCDFMDGDPEAILVAAKCHASHGTTSILPTGVAGNLEQTGKFFEAFRQAKGKPGGANLLGIHLEGPYYNQEYKGAIEEKSLRNPSPDHYERVLSMTDDLMVWSEAPELPGSMEFGRYLERRGILAAIGHSGADFETVMEARENGFHHVTHLYSCTSTVIRRNCFRVAGIVEAAYYFDDLSVEMIADGVHLPQSLLKLIYMLKGADKIAVISDSMRAAGMGDGVSFLGQNGSGQQVIVKDGISWLPDGSGFAGGTGTADRLVRNLIHLGGIPVTDAVRMMTQTPARILGQTWKGRLAVGCDSDLVVFTPNVDIRLTVVGGEIVYQAD